MMWAGKKEGD